jgi:hypothetical protein
MPEEGLESDKLLKEAVRGLMYSFIQFYLGTGIGSFKSAGD